MNTKIYAIRNKDTGEFHSYNGRCAWTKVGNAKNAFDNALNCLGTLTFDTCYYKHYEIIELTEVFYRMEGLDK